MCISIYLPRCIETTLFPFLINQTIKPFISIFKRFWKNSQMVPFHKIFKVLIKHFLLTDRPITPTNFALYLSFSHLPLITFFILQKTTRTTSVQEHDVGVAAPGCGPVPRPRIHMGTCSLGAGKQLQLPYYGNYKLEI